MSFELYRKQVSSAAKKRDGAPIYNGSVEHARIVVENIFSHADVKVDLLSSHLNPDIYGVGNVVEAIEIFLATPTNELRLLTEEVSLDDLRSHPLIKKIGENANFRFHKMSHQLSSAFAYNFVVADGNSYRFEADKAKCVAVAAWGDAKTSSHLQNIFDVLWGDPEPLAANDHATVA